MTLPERFHRTILIGATDGEIVTVTLEIGDERNTPENQYMSFTHHTYNREFFDDEEGEKMARGNLEDGELWRDAVTNKRTELGLDAWVDDVLATDGWANILGDIEESGDLYTMLQSGGAGTGPDVEDFVKLAVDKKDMLFIWAEALKYHLKALMKINKQAIVKIRAIFEKYPEFKNNDMVPYSNQAPEFEEDEKTDEPETRENPEPEQPHGSPVPPIKIPQDWWDEDGRVIMAKHEEEFIDLVIDKFWRRDIFEDEQVETDGAFWGEHNQDPHYEWASWKGEYRVGVLQYGSEMPSPTASVRLSLRINAIDIASRIITIEMVDGKLVPIDRLFLRQSHDAVLKGGAYFASVCPGEEMPLAIAIDKTHFMLRKLLLHGAKMYPILEWVEVSTLTQNGVDPTMQLVAMHPGGGRVTRLAPIDIPTSKFYYDDMIEKGYGLYINLKEQLPERAPGTGGALEKLDFDARMHKELERIFTPGIEVKVEELPITKTSMDEVQKNIDDIEREIRILRAKEHDFDSTNSTVAARLGKQMQYDKLLKERDELMWRENPGPRRVVTGEDMRRRAMLPRFLYHGTSMTSLTKVLDEGLLVHQPYTEYTVESGHTEDTNMNVSLANTIQDAVFFSLGAAGWGGDQAIIEFDTEGMPEEKYPTILRRPLFGKTGRFEYKIYTMKGIPPEHISRVLIRSFDKSSGKLVVKETWYTREEAISAFGPERRVSPLPST